MKVYIGYFTLCDKYFNGHDAGGVVSAQPTNETRCRVTKERIGWEEDMASIKAR